MIARSLYTDQLAKFVNTPQVKVITGIRRSGKSTLLLLLKQSLFNMGISEEQVIAVNFESFVFVEITTAIKLYDYVKRKIIPGRKAYLLFDEIQEVEGWERAVNSFLVDFDVDIYLTGSNSRLLSSELSTYLAGRTIEIPVFTLSYREFLDFRQSPPTAGEASVEPFMQYLRAGGFPVIHSANFDLESGYKTVRDIYSSVILRDTVQHFKIREIELLERVIRYAFDNIGNTFSGKNVADYFRSQQRKTDINTIYNFLHALEESFVFYKVARYNIKGKEILKTQEKYYAGDVSLMYATMGYRDRMIAGILENIVFLELKRRGYQVYVGKLDSREIDFVAEKQNDKIYIQVAYKLDSEQTIQREFSPLQSIPDHYPKWVVSMDSFWKDTLEGIKHFYIADFLLSDKF